MGKTAIRVARTTSCPTFASASYVIFRVERGRAKDVVRALEITELKKYKLERDGKQNDVVDFNTHFFFIHDPYFFFAASDADFEVRNFEYSRLLEEGEPLFVNYMNQVQKMRDEKQARIDALKKQGEEAKVQEATSH